MIEGTRDVAPVNRCPRCEAPADVGHIFCKKCGAALRPPEPLTQQAGGDYYPPLESQSVVRRILVFILKGVVGIAAVVAILCPLTTFTEISLCVGAVFVALVCYFVLTVMDEAHIEGNSEGGYWPKPLDWSARGKTEDSSNPDTTGE